MKLRTSHLVVPAYTFLSLVLTWPLVLQFNRSVPAVFSGFDPLLHSFLIGWDFHALFRDPLHIFNAPVFHPLPGTLTYMDHLIGEAVFASPVLAVTRGVAAGYNVLIALSFVTSGWAVYRILRDLGISRGGSFLAGFLFAFSPYRYDNLGELNQIQTQFLPLGIFFALRFFRTQLIKYAAATLAVLVLQTWFGWYYSFYLGLELVLLGVWKLAEGRTAWSRMRVRPLAGLFLGAVLLILPGVWPYIEQHRAMPQFRRTLGMAVFYSADVLDYLKFNFENWIARRWAALGSYHGFFPGAVTWVLAAVAVAVIRRRSRSEAEPPRLHLTAPGGSEPPAGQASGWLTVRMARRLWSGFRRHARRWEDWGYFGWLAAFAFVMSLGPVLQVAGRRIMIPLPYALAYFVIPGFNSLRVPCRFAGVVVLSLSLLAGFGYDAVRRGGSRRWLFGAAFALALAGSWSVPIPLVRVPDRQAMPPVYQWLARQPGDFPILELPMPAREADESVLHATRQLYALYHGKRRLDGVSGFVPPQYEVFRMVMQGFPRSGTIREAGRMGARYIIFHYGDLAPEERRRVESLAKTSPALRVAALFGDDVVYEVPRVKI